MQKRLVLVSITVLGGVMAIGAVWAAPPLRLAAPGLFGLQCLEQICVETLDDLPAARKLVAEAAATVEEQTGLTVPMLNAILCRSDDCYRRFGGGNERAISYPFLGMLIAEQSWQDYIIRHEMIHLLQFEHFGAIETMRHPVWFREGMAYELSGAPDHDVPDPFKPWMAQYRQWQGDSSLVSIFSAPPAFD